MKRLMLSAMFMGICSVLSAGPVTDLEKKVLAELNLARQEPVKYAGFVERHKKRFINDKVFNMPGKGRIMTQEGRKAVDEAIEFLKKAKPLEALTMSEGLRLAAIDHNNDLGKSGTVGHKGSDGSMPKDRVERYGKFQKTCGENIAFGPVDAREIAMQLIIDDGVPGRGHRDNIYNPAFEVVGISVGNHKKYDKMCTMVLAGGFEDKATGGK